MNYSYIGIDIDPDPIYPRMVIMQTYVEQPLGEEQLYSYSALIEVPYDSALYGCIYTGTETGFVPLPPDGWPDYLDYFEYPRINYVPPTP